MGKRTPKQRKRKDLSKGGGKT